MINRSNNLKNTQKSKDNKSDTPQTPKEVIISWTKAIVGAFLVVFILNGLALASFVVPTGSMENTVLTGEFIFGNKFIYGPSTPQVIPFVNIPLPFYRFPGLKDPEQGDVIIFIFPGNRDEVESKEFQYYLKRCIATAGDTLTIINKKVYVNGVEFPLPPNGKFTDGIINDPTEKWRTFPYGKGYTRDNYGPIRIPKKGDVINLTQENLPEWFIFIEREGHKVSTNGLDILIDGIPTKQYTINENYCFGMGDNRDQSLDSRYWGFIPYKNVVGTPIIIYWSWEQNIPMSNFVSKISSIRWNRLLNIIN